MTSRFALPYVYVPTIDGSPMSGAKLYFYLAGTDTPKNTYSNPELTIANTNPVIANGGGRFGNIFLDGVNYKVILRDADDVLIWTADPLGTEDTYESAIAYATGDGVETAFEIPTEWVGVISPLAMMVFWDGAQQDPNTYEIIGSDIVFSTAPPYNCAITLRNQTVGPRGIGNVNGPSSSTDGAMALFDGTTGELLKNGPVAGTMAQQNANNVAITGGNITVSNGTRALPSLIIGSGGGLYKGGPAVGTFQPMIGFSLDTNRALEMGYVNTSITAGALIRPGAAPTSVSNGIAFRIEGGPGGSTSGRGGALNLFGGAVIDGDGAGVFRIGTNGVGVNRAGGGIGDTCGNGTGTADGGDYTVQAGAGDAGRGGNVTISGGISTSGVAGGFTIRTGTGTAADGNIDNRTAGSLLFRTDNTARWRINGSAAGNAGALEPSTDNAWSVGSGGARPTELYAVSGTINTSDVRFKDIDAEAFPDPLAMLNAINPIAYRLIEGRKVQVGMRQVGTQKVNGIEEPVYEPIFEGRPGTRVHLGFSAQQVREALGSSQYAMWTLDDPADPNSRQGLRTDQMIPVLWKIAKIANQDAADLRATVAALLARVEALEAAQ